MTIEIVAVTGDHTDATGFLLDRDRTYRWTER